MLTCLFTSICFWLFKVNLVRTLHTDQVTLVCTAFCLFLLLVLIVANYLYLFAGPKSPLVKKQLFADKSVEKLGSSQKSNSSLSQKLKSDQTTSTSKCAAIGMEAFRSFEGDNAWIFTIFECHNAAVTLFFFSCEIADHVAVSEMILDALMDKAPLRPDGNGKASKANLCFKNFVL